MKTIQRLFFGFAVPAVAAIVMLAGLAACNRQDGKSASGGAQTQAAPGIIAPESDFEVTSEGDGCVITRYTGPGGNIIIPAEIQGIPVREIGDKAFGDCMSLVSVTIPDGVTVIGYDAFGRCKNLVSATIPDSVTEIGNSAFIACTSLKSIAIPDSVTVIGEDAFGNCTSLASVTIPDGVTVIAISAFGGCESLASVTIPDGVTMIDDWAFMGCTSLKSIAIPDSVTFIGEEAFYGCSRLENVTISWVSERTWRGLVQFKGCKLSRTAQQTIKDAGYPGNF